MGEVERRRIGQEVLVARIRAGRRRGGRWARPVRDMGRRIGMLLVFLSVWSLASVVMCPRALIEWSLLGVALCLAARAVIRPRLGHRGV